MDNIAKLWELCDYIEGIQLASEMDAASGFSVFKRGLDSNENIQALINVLREQPRLRVPVFHQRFDGLLRAQTDPEYAHPHDVALAAYLFVFSAVDSALGLVAAQRLSETPGVWWARKLAQHVIRNLPNSDSVQVNWGASAQIIDFSSNDEAVSYAIRLSQAQLRTPVEISVFADFASKIIYLEKGTELDYQTGQSNTGTLERLVS